MKSRCKSSSVMGVKGSMLMQWTNSTLSPNLSARRNDQGRVSEFPPFRQNRAVGLAQTKRSAENVQHFSLATAQMSYLDVSQRPTRRLEKTIGTRSALRLQHRPTARHSLHPLLPVSPAQTSAVIYSNESTQVNLGILSTYLIGSGILMSPRRQAFYEKLDGQHSRRVGNKMPSVPPPYPSLAPARPPQPSSHLRASPNNTGSAKHGGVCKNV